MVTLYVLASQKIRRKENTKEEHVRKQEFLGEDEKNLLCVGKKLETGRLLERGGFLWRKGAG